MGNESKTCPVCMIETAEWHNQSVDRVYIIVCPACLIFAVSHRVAAYQLQDESFSVARRAALAYNLRRGMDGSRFGNTRHIWLSDEIVRRFREDDGVFITRLQQADNLVRFTADLTQKHGSASQLIEDGSWAQVGASSPGDLCDLAADLVRAGWFADDAKIIRTNTSASILHLRLSVEGWRRWEEITRGQTNSRNGFIAMQFGDRRVDNFIDEHVTGRVAKNLGVQINRMISPGQLRAGLIDNNMREEIENAAFVLVELSHGNRGAYWEAGLAEGLRKPVIYLCEQSVWDDPAQKPHFDVNHWTTIMWKENEPDPFVETLTNTIRNSLRQKYT